MTLPQKGYLLSCFGLLVCISAVFLMEDITRIMYTMA